MSIFAYVSVGRVESLLLLLKREPGAASPALMILLRMD
jgi:hypothetical protein